MNSKKDLHQNIETLKKKMIHSGKKNGLDHPRTIQISKKLDKLITIYMKNFIINK